MKKEKDIINPEHRSGGLIPFSADLSDFAAKLLGKQGLIEMKILTSWKSIVGDELAQYSLPERISFKKNERSEGVLHLIVSGGAFALEIGHNTPTIIEKINTFFGYNAISKIKIIQTESPLKSCGEAKFEDNTEKKLVSIEEQNYINQITNDIKCPKLKDSIRCLGESIFKQKK